MNGKYFTGKTLVSLGKNSVHMFYIYFKENDGDVRCQIY